MARKTRYERYRETANDVEEGLYAKLPEMLGQMLARAEGRVTEVTEEWVPAYTLTTTDDQGKKVPMFPNLDPSVMVCVSRRVKHLPPSESAITYLINRTIGTPITEIEKALLRLEDNSLKDAAQGTLSARTRQLGQGNQEGEDPQPGGPGPDGPSTPSNDWSSEPDYPDGIV